MRKFVLPLLVALPLLLGSAPAGAATPSAEPMSAARVSAATGLERGSNLTSAQLNQARQIILKKTNAFRKAHGKRPLKLMGGLNKVSQRWSVHMAAADVFEHNPNVSRQIPKNWRAWGENIAAGYEVNAVVQAWINSPGHRRNLLGNYTHMGVGYAVDKDSTYTRYYTQNFGKY